MKRIVSDPLFFVGLIVRFLLIWGLSSLAVTDWYVPFMDVTTSSWSVWPWEVWLEQGGTPEAFPYGYVTWLLLLPMTGLVKLLGLPLQYGYDLTLLGCDIAMLAVLRRLVPNRTRMLLALYWLSPIVILATYGLGLNDLIPALALTTMLWLLRRVELRWAGAVLAIAISAKLSMIVALPFVAIYLLNNRAVRGKLRDFAIGLVTVGLVLGIPFVLSSSAVTMLVSNREMPKLYQLAVDLGNGVSVYVVPLVYSTMVYLTWRVQRLNFALFQATTGLAFLLIVLLTAASPGWLIWTIPFLVIYQFTSGRIGIFLATVFVALYVATVLASTPLLTSGGTMLALLDDAELATRSGQQMLSLLQTGMVAVGAVLALRIWSEAISRNDFFRLSRKPFVIGIAGDSGAGKDTLADSLTALIGTQSVVRVSGDDYHLWDRQKPMWQVMTHLNPMANDLEGFANDVVALADGKSIFSRHYDHESGKLSRQQRVQSNDVIIASGLHALYLPILNDCYDLRVYLDIDERLRRYFKLRRDVKQRGHPLERVMRSFQQREPDAAKFIRPQARHADLIFSLQPTNPHVLENLDGDAPLRLRLSVRSRHGVNGLSLRRMLVGICGLHVDMHVDSDRSEVEFVIEGDVTAADMALSAEILCPRVAEFLQVSPRWQNGPTGLMQLIMLLHVEQALTKRFI